MRLPDLFTARLLATSLLTGGEVVPVRVSMDEPVIPLGYRLEEVAETLLPVPGIFGDSPRLRAAYWELLDRRGFEAIAEELREISERHGGRPLVLLDYEDVSRGLGSHRVMFAAWWEERTGRAVYELTDDGRELHWTQLPEQSQPPRPPRPGEDGRWREDAPLPWPMSAGDFARWVAGRFWQTVRSGDHQYSLRAWGPDETFDRAVPFLREHGYQRPFAGRIYTKYDCKYDCGEHFYWTQGAPLAFTTLVNRRRLEDAGEELEMVPALFEFDYSGEERG